MSKSYDYLLIQGQTVCFEDLKIARAKSIALAVINHNFSLSPEFIRRADGSEIILVTFDIQIPQHPKNGIQANEDVAIIIHEEDKDFPEIYALRKDFTFGLPHTNTKDNERPISLCVSEQIFREIKHTFIPFEFIELIRNWFRLTSKGSLHGDDQPLESFFIPNGCILFPITKKINRENFNIKSINESNLFRIEENTSGQGDYFCVGYNADVQKTGFIRKRPKSINDVDEFVKVEGTFLSTKVCEALNLIINNTELSEAFLNKKIVIWCDIPIIRNEFDKKPERTERLFFISQYSIADLCSQSGVLKNANEKLLQKINTKNFDLSFVKNIEIGTYSIMLDFEPVQAAIFNNKKPNLDNYTIIGAGSLGSQVLSIFARTGFGHWTVIDNDNLLPHNLARHALNSNSIGSNKAEKMSEELNLLFDEKIFTPLNADFINIAKETSTKELLKRSKAIVDISTSIAVARILARDYNDVIKVPRISAFLNPKGQDIVILSEDKKREHRLDFLEMEYYRFIYEEPLLNNHLQFENELKVRYNRNSCREITSLINQADVLQLSAVCAKSVRKSIDSGSATIAIWQINPENDSISYYSKQPSNWKKEIKDGWKIYLCDELVARIKQIRINKIESGLSKETGGVLLGTFDFEREIIYVFDMFEAPEDSKETYGSFERGVEGIIEEFEKYKKITENQIQYLGEWHSHPKGCSTKPSPDDEILYKYLYDKLSKQGYPALMAIFGDKDISITFKSN